MGLQKTSESHQTGQIDRLMIEHESPIDSFKENYIQMINNLVSLADTFTAMYTVDAYTSSSPYSVTVVTCNKIFRLRLQSNLVLFIRIRKYLFYDGYKRNS